MGEHFTGPARTRRMMNVEFTTDDLRAIVDSIGGHVASPARRGPLVVSCANPHSLAVAQRSAPVLESLLAADYVLPDGIGVVLMSRLGTDAIPQRITGMDLFSGISQWANRRGSIRYYFLGSTYATLDAIRRRMASEYPSIEIAGAVSPPFGRWPDGENDRIVSAINGAAPDVLWVGMTAPKQELWSHENRARLDVKLVGNIGAVFDYYAGSRRRAGPLVQSLGLEWLARLVDDPRRLWRRTLVSVPEFLIASLRETSGL